MFGSADSSFARLRLVLVARSEFWSDISGALFSSFARVVNKLVGMDTGERLIAVATGDETGVLLGVLGTFFGVVGGDP